MIRLIRFIVEYFIIHGEYTEYVGNMEMGEKKLMQFRVGDLFRPHWPRLCFGFSPCLYVWSGYGAGVPDVLRVSRARGRQLTISLYPIPRTLTMRMRPSFASLWRSLVMKTCRLRELKKLSSPQRSSRMLCELTT